MSSFFFFFFCFYSSWVIGSQGAKYRVSHGVSTGLWPSLIIPFVWLPAPAAEQQQAAWNEDLQIHGRYHGIPVQRLREDAQVFDRSVKRQRSAGCFVLFQPGHHPLPLFLSQPCVCYSLDGHPDVPHNNSVQLLLVLSLRKRLCKLGEIVLNYLEYKNEENRGPGV